MNTTTRLGLKIIDTPAVDTVDQLRQSINTNANILDAQFLESTFALRPAAATKGRLHRSTDTGEIAIDTGTVWEPVWGPASISRSVLDVGLVGQSKAGRQLSVADFTDCGAAAPVGLYNLSDLTDASGNGLTLSNRGAVTFGVGIEGAAATAAVNVGGSATSCLYRADSGAGIDLSMRIRTGSWGAWHKTAKQGVDQPIMHKGVDTGNQRGYGLRMASSGRFAVTIISLDGVNWTTLTGTRRIDDDRWHHLVATYDGVMLRLFTDGSLDNQVGIVGNIFQSTGPLNIGSSGGSSGTAPAETHYGRVDEAFVTGEVLSADQIRHLYGCKIAHGGASPRRATMRVTRRRLGPALANGDFPSSPLRCYNFAAGAYTDLNGGASVTPSGTVVNVAGPDGQKDSGVFVSGGSYLTSSDAGFPSALQSRSYGLWFCGRATGVNQQLMSWGTAGGAFATLLFDGSGTIVTQSAGDSVGSSGGYLDGAWHHAVVVETDSPTDTVKRKLYVDGRVVASSTVLNAVTPTTGLRLGLNLSGGSAFSGALSRAFVFAGALTWDQVQALYMKAAAALPPSPKNAPDHVEMLDGTNLVFVGEGLDPQWQVDLEVSR